MEIDPSLVNPPRRHPDRLINENLMGYPPFASKQHRLAIAHTFVGSHSKNLAAGANNARIRPQKACAQGARPAGRQRRPEGIATAADVRQQARESSRRAAANKTKRVAGGRNDVVKNEPLSAGRKPSDRPPLTCARALARHVRGASTSLATGHTLRAPSQHGA